MRDVAREQLLAELRALRPEFERKGVTRMSMFGSRARGDNRPDSDVDLVVEIEQGRKFSLIDVAGLYGVIEDRIGIGSSIVTRTGMMDNPEFATNVELDEISVF